MALWPRPYAVTWATARKTRTMATKTRPWVDIRAAAAAGRASSTLASPGRSPGAVLTSRACHCTPSSEALGFAHRGTASPAGHHLHFASEISQRGTRPVPSISRPWTLSCGSGSAGNLDRVQALQRQSLWIGAEIPGSGRLT